jgi:hypothetical protein
MAYWVDSPPTVGEAGASQAPPTADADGATGTSGHVRLFVRAVAFPTSPAPTYAVVLDVPLNELTDVTTTELRV